MRDYNHTILYVKNTLFITRIDVYEAIHLVN